MVISVTREEIFEMLERAAREVGLDLCRFYELSTADRLDNPSLRDLRLIWGDLLIEEDLLDAT